MTILAIKPARVLIIAAKAFVDVCVEEAEALGVSAAELAELQSELDALRTANDDAAHARAVCRASIRVRNARQADLHRRLSGLAKRFDGDAAVPDDVLARLQLPPHHPHYVRRPVTEPVSVHATSDGMGNVTVKWDRADNPRGTVFVVEAQTSGGGAWTQIGATTRTRFQASAPVGRFLALRVTASRVGRRSSPSVPSYLWASGESDTALAA